MCRVTNLVVDVHVIEVRLRGVNLRRQLKVGAGRREAHELQQFQVGAVAQAGVRVVRGTHLQTNRELTAYILCQDCRSLMT